MENPIFKKDQKMETITNLTKESKNLIILIKENLTTITTIKVKIKEKTTL